MPKIEIDFAGPEGNAFTLLKYAMKFTQQLGLNWIIIKSELDAGGYKGTADVFEKYFGTLVTIKNRDVIPKEPQPCKNPDIRHGKSDYADSGYNQLCVWRGVGLGDKTPEQFQEWFLEEFGFPGKFMEVVITNPNPGSTIEQSGGRSDILFYIKDGYPDSFAVKRLEYGISWWEDLVSYNHGGYLYSKEILAKYPVTW